MKDLDMFIIEETKDEEPEAQNSDSLYKWVLLLIVAYFVGCIITMVQ